MQYDLFISYAHQDNARNQVRELRDAILQDFHKLMGRNVRVFFDEHDIPSMVDWEKRIAQGLHESRVFLAVISPNYLASAYCRREWEEYIRYEAMRQCLGEGVAPVYFVDVPGLDESDLDESVAPLVREMRKRQWCDLVSQQPVKIVRWHEAGKRALEDAEVARRLDILKTQMAERLKRADRAQQSPTNIYRHNPQFVGRVHELGLLREALDKRGSVGVVGQMQIGVGATAVHGLGGMGKTELALAYAHAFAWDYAGGRWLVRCEGLDNFDFALRELAEPLGITLTREEQQDLHHAAERVLAELRRRERSLLLLDNVTDPSLLTPDVLMRLPSQGHVHIVATTRLGPTQLSGSPRDHTFVIVDELPGDDALALLRAHQPDGRFAFPDDEAAANELVNLLDGFTIAVETAAIYLGKHSSPGAVAAYTERLRGDLLLASEEFAKDSQVAVRRKEKLLVRILEITFDTLDVQQLHVLNITALFSADQIPLRWVRQLATDKFPKLLREEADFFPAAPGPWRKLLQQLLDLRLLRETGVYDARSQILIVRMHRLLQEFLVNRLKEQAGFTQMSADVTDLVTVKINRMRSEWIDSSNHWQLSPLVAMTLRNLEQGNLDAAVRMAIQVQDALWQLGRYQECKSLLRRAFEATASHPYEQVEISAPLARVLRSLGDIDGAIGHMKIALERLHQLDGEHAEAIATIDTNLGRLYLDRGNHAEAAKHLCSAIRLKRKMGSGNSYWLAPTLFNLAELENARGRSDRARRLLKRSIKLHHLPADVFGNVQVTDELDAIRMLATIERDEGNLQESEQLLGEALTKADQLFPYPQVMRHRLRSDLAMVKYLLQDYAGARVLLVEAQTLAEELHGPEDYRLLDILQRITLVEDVEHHWDRSRELHQRIIRILQQSPAYGPTAERTLAALKTLALLEFQTGNLTDAQALLQQVIDGSDSRLSKLSPTQAEELIDTFRTKARVDAKLMEARALQETLERALRMIASFFGPTDQRLDEFVLMLFGLGVEEMGQGRQDQGLAMTVLARNYFTAAGAPPHILAQLDDAVDRFAPSKQSRKVNTEIAAVATESDLGEAHFRSGNTDAARKCFEQSAAAFEKVSHLSDLGTNILEKAFNAYGRLGWLAMDDPTQADKAERLIRRATDIGFQIIQQPASDPWIHGDLAANLHNLGILLANRGERAEAIRNCLSAATLMDQQLKSRGDDAALIQRSLKLHFDFLKMLSPNEFFPDERLSPDAESLRKEIELAVRVVNATERSDYDSAVLAFTLSMLGGLEIAMGEYEAALEHLQRSLVLKFESDTKFYEPGVVLDIQRIVAIEQRRGQFESAFVALQNGIALLQRYGGKHNPMLPELWTTLGKIHRSRNNRKEARAAFEESYEILFETLGPADSKTRESLLNVLSFDTFLGDYEHGETICLRYIDSHPEIQHILKPLNPRARDAARMIAVRQLVLPPDQLAGKEAMQYEWLLCAQQVLVAHGTKEADLPDRLSDFLTQDGHAFIKAALDITRLVLKDSAG